MIIHSQDEWGPFVHIAENGVHTEADWYAIGARKPHYPVPAIRQWIEWGCNYATGEIILLACKQERYSCD